MARSPMSARSSDRRAAPRRRGASDRWPADAQADKLAEDDFEAQLRYLLTALPERKQTLAFSATYPPELLDALSSSMRSPHTVSVLPSEGGGSTAWADDGQAALLAYYYNHCLLYVHIVTHAAHTISYDYHY